MRALATLLASIVLVTAATAMAGQLRPGTAPAPLLGDWGKRITASTWKQHGITYEPAGQWAIEISKQGGTSLHQPPGDTNLAPLTTMRTSTTGHSIVFGATADGFCAGNGTYTWRIAGRTLTFKLTKDTCTARTVLIAAGAWHRK